MCNESILSDKNQEILKIHKEVFGNYIRKTHLNIKIKRGVLSYYNNFINEKNIEKYYNLPMNIFFNELHKTINSST